MQNITLVSTSLGLANVALWPNLWDLDIILKGSIRIHRAPVHRFGAQPRYSHFEPSRGPETLGEDIQPRDVRAPVRKRINRYTGKFLKPELILIGCTNGKSREEAVLNFNHSGLGPNYIIAKDGKSESFVEARPALERIFFAFVLFVYLFGVPESWGPW